MSRVMKAVRLLGHPNKLIHRLNNHGLHFLFSDRFLIKRIYRYSTGKKLNLKDPTTFNEKLQWLKLHNRKPEYTAMVDKYESKKLVAEKIGEEYIISTLGVWEHFDDIDFDALPERFVLKCTHDSGGLVICRDKSKLDKKKARKKIERSLGRNYYWNSREWPYKNVKPRILAEEYVEDPLHPDEPSLLVYKIMCFGGVPKIIQTIQGDKTPNETIDYFDPEWNLLDLRQNFPNSETPLSRPVSLDEMLRLAGEMSGNAPFLRVDFYEVSGRPYFSEFTFFSDSGMAKFTPEEWDTTLGSWINLETVK